MMYYLKINIYYIFFSRLALNAFDSDVGFNGMLEYAIIDDTEQSIFKIDSTTGGIQILQNLDYEKKSNYSFYVSVSSFIQHTKYNIISINEFFRLTIWANLNYIRIQEHVS